jgi:glycosyltransferase involved in cell wall biosynthesis
MTINFTVAICTFNGETRLPAVLDCLLAQEGIDGLTWEVLIVDNNSRDRTVAVVESYAARWRTDSRLRCVSELKQGAAYARDRAIAEAASSDLIGFLDDDNLPGPGWVAAAYAFGQAHPRAGAFGGRVFPKLDTDPDFDFYSIKFLLAIEDRGEQVLQYTRPGCVPGAPGLVVRKQAWQQYVPLQRRLRGHDEVTKKTAPGAEDIETVLFIQSSPWEVWHNPAMEVWHHIPARRLERPYLLKLARGAGISSHACRIARSQPWQRPWLPLLVPMYALNSALRLALYYLQHRHELASEVSKACWFEYNLGVLISPWRTPQPKH